MYAWQAAEPAAETTPPGPDAEQPEAEFLAGHIEAAHTPKLLRPTLPSGRRGGATSSAIEAITDRIADGRLKPGGPLSQNEVAKEIGVSGGSMAAAVRQLVTEGVLVYDGIALRKRALVADAVPAGIIS